MGRVGFPNGLHVGYGRKKLNVTMFFELKIRRRELALIVMGKTHTGEDFNPGYLSLKYVLDI